MREEYPADGLRRSSLDDNPFEQFTRWFKDASEAQLCEPNGFSLATAAADPGSAPSARTVLLKYFDAEGFVFFTNYESNKAREIAENPGVCMLFPWLPLHRQVTIKGSAARISAAESLKYFLKRPRDSQLGAWISQQSSVISSRSVLETKFAEVKRRFLKGDISLPSFWGGYRIRPDCFEFWQGGRNRLHDRFSYRRQDDGNWNIERLAP